MINKIRRWLSSTPPTGDAGVSAGGTITTMLQIELSVVDVLSENNRGRKSIIDRLGTGEDTVGRLWVFHFSRKGLFGDMLNPSPRTLMERSHDGWLYEG